MVRLSQQERKDLTRQRLHAAALPEFSRCGLAASSIDRITDSAGYSRGAFYANYKSKSELALELLTEHSAQVIDAWNQMIEQADDPHVLLRNLAKHFDYRTNEEGWWQLRAELCLEAGHNPEFRTAYENANVDTLGQLRPMISRLCRYAGCEDSTDIEYVALVLQAFTYGFPFERARLSSGKLSPSQMLIRLLLDLIGRPAKFAHFDCLFP